MTYVGQQPSTTFDSGIQDRFTGLSSNTVTLTHDISAETDILVVWNNIVQDSGTYSVGGTGNKTLTLGGTLVSADVVTVYYTNKVMQSVNPTAGSVTSTTITDDIISGQTALGATPADTDELLVSDAGVLKRVDYSYLKGGANTPNFHAKTSSQSISASTTTVVIYTAEDFDTSSLYNTSTGRFTVDANTTGKYFFYASVKYASSSISRNSFALHKNGTETLRTEYGNSTSYPSVNVSGIINLSSSGDYVDARVNQNDGTNSLSGEAEGNFFGGYKIIE
jgi:hypothetical protein